METRPNRWSPEELMAIESSYQALLNRLRTRFNKRPDLNALLFLIGIQEVRMIPEKLTKEQKQDAMHVAICTLLAQDDFYRLAGMDKDGWPHFERTELLPQLTMSEQETLLKRNICRYFVKLEAEN